MIILKRLELQGFKSFANKTILDFPSCLTAIVGPNGSGKSNIVDAFRWVLGEREAKQLRGGKLENLIFAGTPKKPAASVARVSLYFDNRNKNFPVDREEAVLSRRIDRSGVSQFFWNDEETRLKDLVTVLAKNRLGSRGLMVINQGESDIFVKSTPQERRMFIEEILGLREFRLKKDQAERQLEQSNINLEKAKAIVAELTPHLRFLRRQKTKWEKRTQLETELRELENSFFANRYWGIKKESADLDKAIVEVDTELNEVSKTIKNLEENIQKLNVFESNRNEINLIRKEIRSLLEKRSVLEKELGKLEAKIELARTKKTTVEPSKLIKTIEEAKIAFERLINLDDIKEIKNIIKEWLRRFTALLSPEEDRKDSEDFIQQQNFIHSEIKDIEKKLEILNKKEEEILTLQEEVNKKFRHLIETLEAKKQLYREIEQKKERLLFEKEKLELRLKELEHQFRTFDRDINELTQLQPPKVDTSQNWEMMEKKIFRLRTELAAIGEIDEVLVKEADETERRYEFLTKEIKDLEKASADLKAMIKELEVKIHNDFQKAFHIINEEFNKFFRLMFGGGRAHLKLVIPKTKVVSESEVEAEVKKEQNFDNKNEIKKEEKEEKEILAGVEIELNIPRKKIKGLEMLSGGEKSLVSIAALFALISVSPPPFLVLDEIDAALDEVNARRFAQMIKEFSQKTQFIIITHNRATMEVADILYGVTMGDDGVSKVFSLKLESD